ncbi:T9SS type A sorting domain-containing protein, partial [uncultured Flavobacterium sp.]|uniref:T9SS type A sorting domain-containing protein n=1 Tax=uncultured Flavobacterium sp. TaxID=165435 RepID=UPI0030ED4C74
GTGNVEIDEIRVGDNWAFVTPAGTASTKNFDTIAGLSLYPNPVSGNVLNISSTANSAMNVAIFDILGKQVINTKVNNNTVNISSLHAGVYIVKVTEDGKTATRKLVVR